MSSEVSRRALVLGGAGAVVTSLVACSRGETGASTTASIPSTSGVPPTAPPTTSPTTVIDDRYWPPAAGGEWATIEPTEAGFTQAGIDALVALVEARNSESFILLRDGRIVAERFWRDADAASTRDIASCQKSVVSTLVGIARSEGLLALDDRVTDIIGAGWSAADPDAEAIITVHHLLAMTSGLHPRTLRAVAEPGTTWAYNTDAYQKLRRVLEAVSGASIEDVTREWLLGRVGAGAEWDWWQRPSAPTDAVGDPAWGLRLTVRDMARFGLLAMHDGVWAGERVVPDGWFAEAWTPLPVKRDYGYLWWLTGRGGLASTGVPADTVAALGAQDQKIYVAPSAGVVMCRQGDAAGEMSETASDFDRELLVALVAAVDRAG